MKAPYIKEKLDKLKAENEKLRNDINECALTSEVEDEYIHVEDSSNARLKSITVKGNSSQETGDVKNLFDKNANLILGKRFASQNPETLFADADYFITDYIAVKPNTQYSLNINFTDKLNRIMFYDSDKNNIGRNEGGDKQTIITIDNTYYLRFGQLQSNIDTLVFVEGTTENLYVMPSLNHPSEINIVKDKIEILINNGLDTTDENYKLQTYALPIQDEMLEGDYIDFENKKEVHSWNKIILDGSQEFTICEKDTGNEENMQSFKTSKIDNIEFINFNHIQEKVKSNKFKCGIYNVRTIKNGIKTGLECGEQCIYICDDKFKDYTIDQLIQFLKENPITVYYKLATSNELDLTKEQLSVIEQIQQEAHSYKNITNISATSSNKNAILDVEYCKDLNTVINNLQSTESTN